MTRPTTTFNNFPWEEYNMDAASDLLAGKKPRKKIRQKGTGGHYLCSECNNKSGSNYVNAYIDFINQILYYTHDDLNEKGRVIKAKLKIKPLNIFKQILIMFLTINHSDFLNKSLKGDIRDFLTNKENLKISNKIKIYFYSLSKYSTFARRVAYSSGSNILNSSGVFHASEISSIGIGLLLTVNEDKPLNDFLLEGFNELVDITFFSKFNFDEEFNLMLDIPILPNHTQFMCDFRVKKNIKNVLEDGFIYFVNPNDNKAVRPKQ